MGAYIVRRLAATLLVMALVGVFIFLLLHLAPGDPAAIIAGDNASPAQIAKIRHQLGLDAPLVVQFVRWVWHLLHGDFGISIFSEAPVMELIQQRLPATLALTSTTIVFAAVLAVGAGVLAAWRAGGLLDRVLMGFAALGFSVPVFVVGYVLIYVCAIWLRWLPVQGYVPLSGGLWPWASHLILPSIALGLAYVALIARITRASMLEVLSEDYMRTARAKGASTAAMLFHHALKNAGVPIVTVIGIGVALLISGVVITETVFNIPGLGRLTVDAITNRDYPIIQGVIVVFSGAYVLVNLAVDLVYTLIDPRIRVLSTMSDAAILPGAARTVPARRGVWRFVRRNPTVCLGGGILATMVLLALAAPLIAGDPLVMIPVQRLEAPSAAYWFGTDNLGRDVFARTIYGARVSLLVGLSVAAISVAGGLIIGLAAGYYRRFDSVVMRLMDGLMAIPSILLAIALVSLTHGGVAIVILAITIPEVPREVRLVRAVVLSVREQPFVEAAIAGGARTVKVLLRHILPSTIAPLTVQGTYVCASAILVEAGLSFLGAGIPPNIPTWGNMIASCRLYLAIAPWTIFFPGICLAIVVLAVNLLGDGLRDRLDPRLARRL